MSSIDREDTIKILKDLQKDHLQFCLVPFRQAIERVQALPATDRPQEWITCRERMPKKEEATYLICTETGRMCSCRWTNNMYGLGSNEWSKWGWHIMDKPQYAKVVAWMPLKPWKGADDE